MRPLLIGIEANSYIENDLIEVDAFSVRSRVFVSAEKIAILSALNRRFLED